MGADFIVKQGDTEALADTLSYSTESGAISPVSLIGANVDFVMRALASSEPLTLAGITAITDAANGGVSFTPAPQDTATAGLFMASWVVTFANGRQMTFPTVGYLSVSIEENITSVGGAQLVGLPDLKDYLNIRADDRSHDAKLVRFIEAVRPAIENIAGPIIPRTFDEWHDGGQYFIRLRHRPSTAIGARPVLTLTSCDEYRGPARYPLTIITDPSQGSIYSCMLDQATGQVVRRSSGGGVIAFPPMPQSVHVVYQAGQSSIPPNVYEATLELIRVNYQTTQPVGRGRLTVSDDQDQSGPALGFFVPRRVRELLAPNRRAPSIA
jgi:hypothetical protein